MTYLQGFRCSRIVELDAISYYLSAIEKCEEMRGSLRDNDQFVIRQLLFEIMNIEGYTSCVVYFLCQVLEKMIR